MGLSSPFTNHRIKWDHFEILATGRSDMHCKIKESLLIRDLKPALNENVGSESQIEWDLLTVSMVTGEKTGHKIIKECEIKHKLWGGRTRANSVCFTNSAVKIWAFPNATSTGKIWKNLPVDQKDQRRRSVWVGQADFSKMAQIKQKFIKCVSCVFI